MMTAILRRDHQTTHQTTGLLQVLNEKGIVIFACLTLEKPWLDNLKRESCIPRGFYKVIPRKSPKYGNHFQVLDVPNREYILFHFGNFYKDTAGCILVGRTLSHLNDDTLLDLTSSVDTMTQLRTVCPNGFNLAIF